MQRGTILRSVARLNDSEAAAREAVATAERAFGRDDRQTLMALNDLALSLQALGKRSEAEGLLREVLDRRESVGRRRA
jgi:hypothetical protein